MRINLRSLGIRIVALAVALALGTYGCSASRVVSSEIVRGKVEKTEGGKRYLDKKIYFQELSPLRVRAVEITETKEIKTLYYNQINRVEEMTIQEGFGSVFTNLFLSGVTYGIWLLFWMVGGYRTAKDGVQKCSVGGEKIGGYKCTKTVSEKEMKGDNSLERVQEEVIIDKKESPAFNIDVLVTVNETFKTRLTTDASGIASLNLYEFPELARSRQSLKIEYRAEGGLLTTQLPMNEVQKIFASFTPARLRIKPTIVLEDGLSSGILQAGEKGAMLVDVMNEGKGPAFGVNLSVSGKHPGLSYDSTHEIGDMRPGETRRVRIPVTSSIDVRGGKVDFAFQAKEQMGRDSLLLKLQPPIIIKELDKPQLALISFSWADSGGYASGNGNSIPENNETVALNVKVQNSGIGVAKGVFLRIKDLPGVETVVSGADLGNIPPGGIKEGRLAVHFPKLYKPEGKDLLLNFMVSDSRPIGISMSRVFKLPYQYNEPVLKVADIEIFDGDPNTNSRGNMNHLIDQDEEIEMRVHIENAGTLQAEGISVSLSTNKQNVRITPPEVNLGTLLAGEKRLFASFIVEVPVSVSPGPMAFNIAVKQKDYPPISAKLDRTVLEASAMVGVAAVKGRGPLVKSSVMLSVPENIDEVPYLADYRNKNAYALVVGVGNYKQKDVRPLPFAKSDAESIRRYLENIGGFSKENVKVLTDEEATLTQMRKYLKDWLKFRVDKNSLVVVYFSGHGVPELEKKNPYLLPFDGDPNAPRSTGYSISELKTDCNALPTKNVVIALDACYTGNGRSASPAGAKGSFWVEADHTSTEAMMISASKPDQTAWDYPEKSHGLFTYFFLKGMRGKGVDLNRDGFVDLDELFRYIKSEVTATSRQISPAEQSPVMIGLGKGLRLTRAVEQ